MARTGDSGSALNWHWVFGVFAGHSVVGELAMIPADTGPLSYLAKTGYSHNTVSILAHRLRRWPNIKAALGE